MPLNPDDIRHDLIKLSPVGTSGRTQVIDGHIEERVMGHREITIPAGPAMSTPCKCCGRGGVGWRDAYRVKIPIKRWVWIIDEQLEASFMGGAND